MLQCACLCKAALPTGDCAARWRVWLGAVALIGYIVLFNLLVVVAQTKLNRASPALLSRSCIHRVLLISATQAALLTLCCATDSCDDRCLSAVAA